jgi:NAD(P)H-dependent FMN reductase
MQHIITLGGSSSKKSINKQLAEYVGRSINNIELTNIDLNTFEMPLFSVDIESEQEFPPGVTKLNEIFDRADGFVVSLAEHNGAYSAAFKNVYDWLSRMESNVWRGKPMILMSASPSGRGGQTVLEIALAKFSRMGANIVGNIPFPSFYDNFREGEIVDIELKTKVVQLVTEFEKVI